MTTRDLAWITRASRDQIVAARDAGEIPADVLALVRPPLSPLQHDGDWMTTATPQQIVDAYRAGQLADYQATPTEAHKTSVNVPPETVEPVNPEGRLIVQRGSAWVAAATPQQIVDAKSRGELVEYLGGTVNDLGNRVDAHGRVM